MGWAEYLLNKKYYYKWREKINEINKEYKDEFYYIKRYDAIMYKSYDAIMYKNRFKLLNNRRGVWDYKKLYFKNKYIKNFKNGSGYFYTSYVISTQFVFNLV